jgi:MFS family permease
MAVGDRNLRPVDLLLLHLPVLQRHLVRVGYAYWAESFPTRMLGTAIGWLGAMFSGGLLIGSGVWTALIGHFPPLVVWYAVALGFSVIQLLLTLTLPNIRPGQELKAIAS